MTSTILDLFAGPGGWSTGLRTLGVDTARDEIGVEWDEHAAATARKAGHRRLVADVATLDYTGRTFTGVIASPPCQGFSMAGKGKGRADSELLVAGVHGIKAADDPLSGLMTIMLRLHKWMTDDRSLLALEPLRAVLATMPEWTCWEQVPAVLPLWEACADVLRTVGYDVETGNVQAEQYGVPQTRKRAILRAVRGRTLRPLAPTHSRYYPRQPGKLDLGVQPWVSMADALGWNDGRTAQKRMGAGMVERHGERPGRSLEQPAFTVRANAGGMEPGGFRWEYVNGNQVNSARRPADRPAPTIHFGERMNLVTWQPTPAIEGETSESITWPHDRPSPTIVGSFAPDVVAAPGYRKAGDPPRQKTPGSVRVTVQEAAILQSFPPDYPWQGTRTAQYRQVGDACPPLLSAHIVASVLPIDSLPIEWRS